LDLAEIPLNLKEPIETLLKSLLNCEDPLETLLKSHSVGAAVRPPGGVPTADARGRGHGGSGDGRCGVRVLVPCRPGRTRTRCHRCLTFTRYVVFLCERILSKYVYSFLAGLDVPEPGATAASPSLDTWYFSAKGSSLSPGKGLHHQRSSGHAMVPLSDASPHPEGGKASARR
jgi:hypothetical protein